MVIPNYNRTQAENLNIGIFYNKKVLMNKLWRLIIVLFLMAGYCCAAPKEVVYLANKEIPGIIKKVFEDDKVGFGFSETDKLDQLSWSKPYTILALEQKDFEECKNNLNINCLGKYMDIADSLKTWEVIVKINNVGRFIVYFIQENGKWIVLGWGGSQYAEDFNKLFELYGTENVQLFGTNAPFQFYYHIKKYGKKNLTLLDHKKVATLAKDASDEEIAKVLAVDDIFGIDKKTINGTNSNNKKYLRCEND